MFCIFSRGEPLKKAQKNQLLNQSFEKSYWEFEKSLINLEYVMIHKI